MKRNLLLVIILLMFISMETSAQWECPSRLASKLKPFGSSNLMWANEITTVGGVLGDYYTASAMDFLGLNYTYKKHTIYVEGGLKFWWRLDSTGYNELSNFPQDLGGKDGFYRHQRDTVGFYNRKLTAGLREAFYKYKTDNSDLTIGLHSAKGDEFYLLSERIVGLNYRYEKDAWKFNLIGASVIKEFTRNGTFCTLGYLYNVIPRRERAIVGDQLGQTDFGMFTLAYMPTKRKKAKSDEFAVANDSKSSAGNEFSSDESAKNEKFKFKCESIGLVGYDEFGSWIDNNAFLGGLYSELDLFQIFTLKPEVLYQKSLNNDACIYSITAEKQIGWDNGQQTKLYARYIGIKAIDSLAIAKNSYSNVFAGEVIRLDALDLPFFQASIRQSFPKSKFSIRLQMAQQVGQGSLTATDIAEGKKGKKMSEYDIVLVKNIGENFFVMGHVGYLNFFYLTHDHSTTAPLFLDRDFYTTRSDFFAKLEVRLTF